MWDEQRAIAEHEAGHAAMAWLCGFDTIAVNTHQTANGRGLTHTRLTSEQAAANAQGDRDVVRRLVLVCCAGFAASVHYEASRGPVQHIEGFNDDVDRATVLLARIGETSDAIDAYRALATHLLDRFGWTAADRAAAILLAGGELSNAEIASLRASVGVVAAPEDIAVIDHLLAQRSR